MDKESILLIIALVLLLVVLIGIGYISSKQTKTGSDFALAGRNMGPLLVAATMIATYGSASSYLGNPGLAYEYGWPMAWIWVGCIVGIVIPTLFLGPKMRMISIKYNALTIPDLLGKMYDSRMLQLIISIGIIVFYTPMMIAQLKGVGIVFNTFFGGSFNWAILIFGFIIVGLSAKGGLNTVAWTDAAQSLFMAVLMLFIVPASIYLVGGWTAMETQLSGIDSTLTGIFEPIRFTPITVFFMMIYYSLWQIGQPYMSIRMLALKDGKSFRKVVIYLIIFTTIIGGGMWGGYAGRILLPGIQDADSILPELLNTYFPVYISVFALVGILAAILTTVSSILHSIGTTVAHDIISEFFKINLSDKQSLKVSQISTFVIGAFTIIASLFHTPDFLAILVYGALGGTGSLVVGPILMGLFDKKTTKEGAIIASLTGCVSFSILLITGYDVWISGAIGMISSIILTFILSRFFGRPSQRTRDIHGLLHQITPKKKDSA